MGAEFSTLTVKSKNREEVKEQFKNAQDNDRYENGHSNSGGLGMANGLKFTGKRFESYSEAVKYLSDTAEKWESALAVEIPDGYLIGAWCSS